MRRTKERAPQRLSTQALSGRLIISVGQGDSGWSTEASYSLEDSMPNQRFAPQGGSEDLSAMIEDFVRSMSQERCKGCSSSSWERNCKMLTRTYSSKGGTPLPVLLLLRLATSSFSLAARSMRTWCDMQKRSARPQRHAKPGLTTKPRRIFETCRHRRPS
jgi:hypothetical protein